MTIRAIIFDVDGVLVDSLDAHLKFCRRKAQEYEPHVQIPNVDEFKSDVARSGMRISPMHNFLRAVGFSEENAKKAAEDYGREFKEVELSLFSEIDDLLDVLSRCDVQLGIVTANERPIVEKAIGEERIEKFFERSAIATKSDYDEFSKSVALQEVAEHLNIQPSEILFIGDQHSDVEAACKADVEFLGARWGWGISVEDGDIPTIGNPLDILDYVRNINPSIDKQLMRRLGTQYVFDGLSHSRDMFKYYAGQRMTSLRFYLLGSAALVAALVALITDASILRSQVGHFVGVAIIVVGLFITFVFYSLDKRNESLVDSAERLSRRLERMLSVKTTIREFETLLYTDERRPAWRRYGKLMPVFFGGFALTFLVMGYAVLMGGAANTSDLDNQDQPSPNSRPIIALDPVVEEIVDKVEVWGNEFLSNGVVIVAIGIIILTLFLLFRRETDMWIVWPKRITAAAGAAGAVVGVLAAITSLFSDTWNWLDRDVKVTRIFSIPGFESRVYDPTVFVLDNGAAILARTDDDVLATFIVPFETEASCMNTDKFGNWKGTYPTEHANFLRRLASDLAACADMGQPSKIIPAKIRVRGFSSTSTLRAYSYCNGATDPDEANVAIANRRARVVKGLLTAPNLDVEMHEWKTVSAMERGRGFNDRLISGAYDERLGILTRRVEVELITAPLCEGPDQSLRLRP